MEIDANTKVYQLNLPTYYQPAELITHWIMWICQVEFGYNSIPRTMR